MHYINEKNVKGLDLPGRNWKWLIDTEASGCNNIIMGAVSVPIEDG